MTSCSSVLIIGGGLAGSDAAWFLANSGIRVVLADCKRITKNPSQKMETFSELVCSNSLKSMSPESAHGILKSELQAFNSIVLQTAIENRVPAGDALAVDRRNFSEKVTEKLSTHTNITIVDEEIDDPIAAIAKYEASFAIIASGPLTSKSLENWIKKNISEDDFYFYDAIAPVVDASTLDMDMLYFKDRYEDLNDQIPDHLNAPFSKTEYEAFVNELKNAKKVPARDFEEYIFFESCLPIDLMCERGLDTARFSCMRPVGLQTGDVSPYAVVQLRKENLSGEAYNLIGFQTRLTYPEQDRVFRMIPGFKDAKFLKYGSVHRNSYLNAKKLLNSDLSSKKFDNIYFAGQITGVEGYTESAMTGDYVALNILRRINSRPPVVTSSKMAIGALINYLMTSLKPIPSNINFGLFEPVYSQTRKKLKRDQKRGLIVERAAEALLEFKKEYL